MLLLVCKALLNELSCMVYMQGGPKK